MKTTLSLSFEEGLEVVQAMRNVALESGWTEDELKDSDVIEEYSKVLDAALEAMGIDVNIATKPSEEEEEEEEEEEDTTQYSLTPKGEFVCKYMEKHKEQGVSFEEACEIADILFGKSQEDEEEDEEEEEEDDDEELPSDEEVSQMIKRWFGGL